MLCQKFCPADVSFCRRYCSIVQQAPSQMWRLRAVLPNIHYRYLAHAGDVMCRRRVPTHSRAAFGQAVQAADGSGQSTHTALHQKLHCCSSWSGEGRPSAPAGDAQVSGSPCGFSRAEKTHPHMPPSLRSRLPSRDGPRARVRTAGPIGNGCTINRLVKGHCTVMMAAQACADFVDVLTIRPW